MLHNRELSSVDWSLCCVSFSDVICLSFRTYPTIHYIESSLGYCQSQAWTFENTVTYVIFQDFIFGATLVTKPSPLVAGERTTSPVLRNLGISHSCSLA